jgi:hypothetical protein
MRLRHTTRTENLLEAMLVSHSEAERDGIIMAHNPRLVKLGRYVQSLCR